MMDSTKYLALGLDISTDCIGCSVMLVDGQDIEPVEVSHLKLKVPKSEKRDGVKYEFSNIEKLFMKVELFRQKMVDYAAQYKISRIIIEEPLISSNNQYTVSTLLRYNGICSYVCKSVFDVFPEYISSYDARKYGMPSLMAIRKTNKKGEPYPFKDILKSVRDDNLVLFGAYQFDIGKKDIVWSYIADKYPDIQWTMDKDGELAKGNFDATDSIMCVMGQVNKDIYEGKDEATIVNSEVSEYTKEDGTVVDRVAYTVSFCGQKFDKIIDVDRK